MKIYRNQLLFYYPVDWQGSLVTEYSGKYSHCTVAYIDDPDNYLASCVLEFSSFITGQVFRKINLNINFDVYTIKQKVLDVFDDKAAWMWAEERVRWCNAHPIQRIFAYDYLGLIGYLFQNKKLNKPKAYFCSECIDQFGLAGGISLREDLQQWQDGPTDIANSNLIDYSFSNIVRK